MICCEEAKKVLESNNFPIALWDITKEYYLFLQNTKTFITINYCPWYGKRIGLAKPWAQILLQEHNIDITDPDYDDRTSGTPAEFLTDEWWKKRGL